MKIGYLRVSTEDQKADRQFDAMRAICDRLYLEVFSAKDQNRPVLKRMLRRLKRGDTLVVMSIDRAFRSTVDAISQADRLRARGIEFQILNMAIDTATADGRLAYTIVAAVAQHERDRISERTIQGLQAARRRGKRLGRPEKLTRLQAISALRQMRAGQASLTDLAAYYEVHPWTLTRSIRRLNKMV